MKKLTKITSAILAVAMLGISAVSTAGAVEQTEVQGKIDSTTEYLQAQDSVLDGSLGNEWVLFGLARNNALPDGVAEKYAANLEAKVTELGSGKLDKNKSTENSRVILALSAMGVDARDIAGYSLIEPYADFKFVTKQGLNGPVFTLLAVDTYGYEIPEVEGVAEQTTREKLIEYILSKQVPNGGWAFYGTTADPDMTFMTVTSLAPYYDKNEEVKAAVDRAVDNLGTIQQSDGYYTAWGSSSSESLAQVIVGLSAVGVDADTDSRYVKDMSAFEAFMSFACDNGFKHTLSGTYNGMATEQGYYALIAYNRFKNGERSLYDMFDAAPVEIKFDVNRDGTVTVSDVAYLQKYLLGLADSASVDESKLDLNDDGVVNVLDASLVQRYLAGTEA